MLKETIIVEGKNDIAAVKRSVDAEVIATGGFGINGAVLDKIRIAYEKRGIIILTDPDHAGEHIRKKLSKHFPRAGQAFLALEDACVKDDVGVERASPQAILAALSKTRARRQDKNQTFSTADMFANGLSGQLFSARRRNFVGDLLGIGYANARQFLARLNDYEISRHEFNQAVAQVKEENHAGSR